MFFIHSWEPFVDFWKFITAWFYSFMKIYYHLTLLIHKNLLSPDFTHSWELITVWFYSFMKTHHRLTLLIHESLSPFDFIYSWNSFTFYLFMKASYSHIPHHSCKVHAFSHIFFEHLHGFRTFTYVQIKIKFSKTAFLSKYCKFDIWSYSSSKLNHINPFFKTWSHSHSVFELDHIIFFFYERRESLTWEKKEVSHEKRSYFVTLLLGIRDSNSLNIAIWSMKFISPWISLVIARHSMSPEFNWTYRLNSAKHN